MALTAVTNTDLKLLSVFRVVTQCGGFALAQAELNVSQATISIQIKNLETRLGLKLCQRGRGGFALTEDGQRVYDAANALFNHIEDFRVLAMGYEQLVGELQIGVIDNAVFHETWHLAEVIADFGQLNHKVDISLHVGPPNQLEQLVLSGQTHFGIGFFPRRLSQLTYEPLFEAEMELYCGPRHPLFDVSADDVTVKQIEAFPHAQRGYVSYEQLPDNEKSFEYTARAQSIEGLAQFILSGCYLAFLPTHYARQWVSKGEMVSLLPDRFRYSSVYEIIRRKSASRTPAEKKFFEVLLSSSNLPSLTTT